MGIFERALVRAGCRARFTEGFNPKPRLEFARPLPLGVASAGEVASVELEEGYDGPEGFAERLNRALPEGLRVLRAQELAPPAEGQRKRSLMSLFWGADYRLEGEGEALAEAARKLEAARAGGHAALNQVRPAPGGLAFRLRQTEAEGAGVLRFLAETAGLEPLKAGLRLTREGVLAAGGEGEAVSYFG